MLNQGANDDMFANTDVAGWIGAIIASEMNASLNSTSQLPLARTPITSQLVSPMQITPGVVFGTITIATRAGSLEPSSIRANAAMMSAAGTFEKYDLRPLIRQPPSTLLAVVCGSM